MRVQQLVERAISGEEQTSLLDEYLGLEEMSDARKASLKKLGKKAVQVAGVAGTFYAVHKHGQATGRKDEKADRLAASKASRERSKASRKVSNQASAAATKARKAQEKDQPKQG